MRLTKCKLLSIIQSICIIAAVSPAGAQITDYTFSAYQGTFNEISVSGGAIQPALTGGDMDAGYFSDLPIGFNFKYDGTIYASLSAATDGVVTLGNTLSWSLTYNDLIWTGPRPLIALLWDNLKIDTTGSFLYQTEGTAPNRVFTAQWLMMYWDALAASPSISFQLKIHETSNNIEFIYRQEAGSVGGYPGASIGITGTQTGTGSFLSLDATSSNPGVSSVTDYNWLITPPASGQVYAFHPPVATGAPNCANMISPYHYESNVSVLNTTLTWTTGGGVPDGYLLYFGEDGGGLTPPTSLVNGVLVNSPYVHPAVLNYSTTYYWQIVPFNSFGNATGCPVYQFTTQPDPTLPLPFVENFNNSWSIPPNWTTDMYISSYYGYNGTNGLSRELHPYATECYATTPPVGPLTGNPRLEFDFNLLESYGYPLPGHAMLPDDKIYVMISTDQGMSYDTVYTIDQSNHMTTDQYMTCTVSLSQYTGSTVMLKIKGVTVAGDFSVSLDNFTIFDNSQPPQCTNPLVPYDYATDISTTTPLVWQNASGATGYRLYLGSDGSGYAPPSDIVNGDTVTLPFTLTAPLAYSSTYYWQIVPFNDFGSATGCPIWRFTTIPDPTRPLPFIEDFNSSYGVPAGWTTDMWYDWSHGAAGTPGMFKYLYNSSPDCWLELPPVGPVTQNTLLEFDYRLGDYNNYPANGYVMDSDDKLLVLVSSDMGLHYDTVYTMDINNQSVSSSFQVFSMNIGYYSGSGVLVKLFFTNNGTGDLYLDLDNFAIFDNSAPPPCSGPNIPWPGSTDVLPNISLSWQSTFGTTGYLLFLGTDGGGVTTPTSLINGDPVTSPYQPNPMLAYSTTYYWQIVPFNANGNASGCPIWSFTTRTDPTKPLPFAEDFNATTNLPQDWNSDMWIANNHGTGGSNGLYRELYYWNNTCFAMLPPVGLITPNTMLEMDYRLTDYYSNPPAGYFMNPEDRLWVLVSVDLGNSFDTVYLVNSTNHVNSAQFATLSVPIGAYAGFNVMVKVVAFCGSYGNFYIDLDNFNIFDCSGPPACVNLLYPPDGDTTVGTGPALAWTNTPGSQGYRVYCGTDGGGILQPSNIVSGTLGSSPFSLPAALNYGVTYYWQVVPFNSFGSASGCPIRSFTVISDPTVLVFPYYQDFEVSVPPIGWNETMVQPGYSNPPDWTAESMGNYPFAFAHSGNLMASFNSHYCSYGAQARLVTPPVNFSALTNPAVTFWMYHEGEYSWNYSEGIQVQVSADNGATWSNEGNLFLRYSPVAGWEQHSVSLLAFAGQTVMIGFLGQSNGGNNCYLDDVTLLNQGLTIAASPDVAMCPGGTAQLDVAILQGTPPYQFAWTPSAGLSDTTLQNPIASPAATTTYTVQVTDGAGLVATDQVIVEIYSLPVVTLAPFAPVCINSSIFPGTGGIPLGGTYTGPGISGNLFDPSAAGVGTHTITYTYTDPHGCTDSAWQNIVVNPLPVVTFSPLTPVCVNALPMMLTGGLPTGGNYSGPGVSAGVFNPVLAGVGTHTITYTYIDPNGCMNSAGQAMVVNSVPVVNFTPLPPVCINWPPFVLTGGTPAGGTYSGNGVTAGYFDPAMSGPGSFLITYTYTSPENCSNSASVYEVVSLCTGIEENEGLPAMSLYPNPTGGVTGLSLSGIPETVDLQIINLQGQTVLVKRIDPSGKQVEQIDLSGYPKGIYYLRVTGATWTHTLKLILR